MKIASIICAFFIVGAAKVIAEQPQKDNKIEALKMELDQADSVRIHGTLMFWDPSDEGKRFIDATSTSPEVIMKFSKWMKSVSWKPIDFYEPFASATTVGIDYKIKDKLEKIAICGGCLKVGSRIYTEPEDTELSSGSFLRRWLSENRDRFVFVKDK